jgi:peptide/nickel transport system ATP-binding protein
VAVSARAPVELPSSAEVAAPPLPEGTPAPSAAGQPDDGVILTIRDLRTHFFTYDGVVKALDGVTFKIRRGETTGLVGETGCGKSVTAFSITRLIPDPPGRVMGGEVEFDGAELLWGLEKEAKFRPVAKTERVKVRRSFRRIKAANERMTAVRGRRISMIFQEPGQAMNPIFSVANQLSEVLLLHRGIEIVDGMLNTEPNAPEAAEATDALLAAATRLNREEMMTAARHLGTVVRSESFGTRAFYIARSAGATALDARPLIDRARKRLHLSHGERRYLAHRRRLMELSDQLKEVYFEEMKTGTSLAGRRRRIQNRMRVEQWSHFYYGLWGIRTRIQKPITEETFWRSVRLLEGVSIANPSQVARSYPHELSGGMLQRVMIAMALSSEPDVLIADEPTTALDVTIQAQILGLMRDLKTRVGTAILLITHDLAVIAEVADRVCVMYAGQIIEQGPVTEIFRQPLHPYAQGLLQSIPRLDQPEKELRSIPGSVPDLIHPPSGCRFHPRCPYAMPICKEARPPVTVEGPEHFVACYLYKGPVAAD